MHACLNNVVLNRDSVDQDNWYVLYTRPNFEKRINKELNELGFYSYLPLQKELRQWNDRKVWIESPLFKSYLFIKISLREKDLAFKVDGILRYVRIGSELARLSEQEINRIKQLCMYEGNIIIDYEKVGIGKKVEFSEGVLKGLKGILVETNDNRKVKINIGSLNCFANVIVDFDLISLKYIS